MKCQKKKKKGKKLRIGWAGLAFAALSSLPGSLGAGSVALRDPGRPSRAAGAVGTCLGTLAAGARRWPRGCCCPSVRLGGDGASLLCPGSVPRSGDVLKPGPNLRNLGGGGGSCEIPTRFHRLTSPTAARGVRHRSGSHSRKRFTPKITLRHQSRDLAARSPSVSEIPCP